MNQSDNKKYQVFVSSTFVDLKEERQAASRAILNLGHFPAGMELFPASDTEQFEFIKRVIDKCDYYVLILGGRYGSLTEDGLSFTELEYNYAEKIEKPVLAFLHSDVSELPTKKVDIDKDLRERLAVFQEKVKSGRLVEFWDNKDALEAKITVALIQAMQSHPQIGWRRGNIEASAEFASRLQRTESMRDFYKKKSFNAESKLKSYEDIEKSEILVRYETGEFEDVVLLSGEDLIKEFAADLTAGIDKNMIAAGLFAAVRHKGDNNARSVSPSAVKNAELFFEVFEIAEKVDGFWQIREDKKWLLKAAFLPLKRVSRDAQLADEIPF